MANFASVIQYKAKLEGVGKGPAGFLICGQATGPTEYLTGTHPTLTLDARVVHSIVFSQGGTAQYQAVPESISGGVVTVEIWDNGVDPSAEVTNTTALNGVTFYFMAHCEG